jgi:Ca2+-binding EF-hand superfamily protein
VSAAFREADGDNSGYLDIEEVKPMCLSLIKKFGGSVNSGPAEEAAMLEKMFAWLDSDGSGRVSFHEFKVQMMRSYIKKALPEELLQ